MSKAFVLVFFIFASTRTYILCENCDELGILLYEDLACKPKGAQDGSCPTHFECDEFTTSKNSCLFQGKNIEVGQQANESIAYAACKANCICIPGEGQNTASFRCASLDCSESLGAGMPNNCYLGFELGKCCAVGPKCPPFVNIATCTVDGQRYREGEEFSPPNSCLECVCQKGFEGKFEAPFCQRRICAEQIDSLKLLAQHCAPVYFSKIPCCPQEWACPSSTDVIKKISTKPDTALTCKWGEKTVKLGEGVETKVDYWGSSKNVVCECILPPLLTCREAKK